MKLQFCKELYSKVALLKAAYNFTDQAYVHLDSDSDYYYVDLEPKKEGNVISTEIFENEMLAQSVRHEVYLQTKNIRELMLARAMATSLIMSDDVEDETEEDAVSDSEPSFSEDEILKDWFADHD